MSIMTYLTDFLLGRPFLHMPQQERSYCLRRADCMSAQVQVLQYPKDVQECLDVWDRLLKTDLWQMVQRRERLLPAEVTALVAGLEGLDGACAMAQVWYQGAGDSRQKWLELAQEELVWARLFPTEPDLATTLVSRAEEAQAQAQAMEDEAHQARRVHEHLVALWEQKARPARRDYGIV